MSHVTEHCETPRITRRWKRLGPGAMWSCSCGKVYRLVWDYEPGLSDCGYHWSWRPVTTREAK